MENASWMLPIELGAGSGISFLRNQMASTLSLCKFLVMSSPHSKPQSLPKSVAMFSACESSSPTNILSGFHGNLASSCQDFRVSGKSWLSEWHRFLLDPKSKTNVSIMFCLLGFTRGKKLYVTICKANSTHSKIQCIHSYKL